jgi:predicted permease
MATEDLVAQGEPAATAADAARREMGNFLLIREVTRDMWGGRWWRDLLEDVQYGLRVLWKNPRFLTAAVLTLALGIGANTALFSVVSGVLLNPLPYPHPEELVTLHESKPNFSTGSISFPNFLDWQKDNQTFSSMAVERGTSFILTGLGDAEQIDALFVSSDFFRQLGVRPALGRDFVAGEDRVGAAPVAMITAGFRKRKFGMADDVIGRSLVLDGKAYTIIGVAPASFDLLGMARSRELFVPVGQWSNPLLMNRAAGLGFHGIGRLKPGVTVAQARSDMERVSRNLAEAYPDSDKGIGAALIPLRERVLGQVQPFLLLLFGAVGFVLLIACVNVANLLLARSTGRAHEFAIRMALGAGRDRILRQLLTESVLLAAIGGGLGVFLAALLTKAALAVLPESLPRAAEVGIDARVPGFCRGDHLACGNLFRAAARDKMQQIRRATGAERGWTRWQRHAPQNSGCAGRSGDGSCAGSSDWRRADDSHSLRPVERKPGVRDQPRSDFRIRAAFIDEPGQCGFGSCRASRRSRKVRLRPWNSSSVFLLGRGAIKLGRRVAFLDRRPAETRQRE